MKFTSAGMKDLWLIEPTVFPDNRGYFFEGFNKQIFEANTNLNIDFVQDNESKSTKGVLRGMHFQRGRYAQAKLVRATHKFKEDTYDDALAYIVQSHDMHKEKSEEIDTNDLLGVETKPRTKW